MTTRIITFLVGDPYKLLPLLLGGGPHPKYIFKKAVGKLHSMPCSLHPNLLEIQSATIKIQQVKQMSSVGEATLSRSLLKFANKQKKAYRFIRMIHVALGLLLTWPQNKMPYPQIHKLLLQRTRSRGRYTFMLKGTNRHTAHFQLATTSVVSSQFVGFFSMSQPQPPGDTGGNLRSSNPLPTDVLC